MSKKELLEVHKGNIVRVGYRILGTNGMYKTVERGAGFLVDGGFVATGDGICDSAPRDVCAEYFAEIVEPAGEGSHEDGDEEDELDIEEEYDMARMTLLDRDEARGICIFSLSRRGPVGRKGLSMNDRMFQSDGLLRAVEALS